MMEFTNKNITISILKCNYTNTFNCFSNKLKLMRLLNCFVFKSLAINAPHNDCSLIKKVPPGPDVMVPFGNAPPNQREWPKFSDRYQTFYTVQCVRCRKEPSKWYFVYMDHVTWHAHSKLFICKELFLALVKMNCFFFFFWMNEWQNINTFQIMAIGQLVGWISTESILFSKFVGIRNDCDSAKLNLRIWFQTFTN